MSDKIIVTVSGVDRVGIVSEVSTMMAKYDVNIEDIKQTLMQGYFVMFMLCSIENSKYTFKEIKEAFTELGKKMNMEIWVQKKEIVDNMHQI